MTIHVCPDHGSYGTEVSRRPVCAPCRTAATRAYHDLRAAHAHFDRWTDSRIPDRLQNRSLANFRGHDAGAANAKALVEAWLDAATPEGLLLSGPVGSGKSHLAVAALHDLVERGMSGRYVATPDLLDDVRRSFGERGSSADRITDELRRVGVLVLDEIGAHTGTPWETNFLGQLIDARYREQRVTIFATNLAPGALAAFIGERGADRLSEYAMVVAMAGASYRPMVAGDAALRNAKPVVEKPNQHLEVRMHRDGEFVVERFGMWQSTPPSWIDRSVQP